MKLTGRRESRDPVSHPQIPRDLKIAIEAMRTALEVPLSMAELAQRCGVAERTLNEHFRVFFGTSPMRYFRRLRLSAAREVLRSGASGVSVTEVANRFEFYHLGRFANHYARQFGESPSTTLALGRAAAQSGRPAQPAIQEETWPRNGGSNRIPATLHDKPVLAILPCKVSVTEPNLLSVAECLAERIAVALSSVRSLCVTVPRLRRTSRFNHESIIRQINARYILTGTISSKAMRLRVILRLVESVTGRHVWGDSFEGDQDQVFELQDRISEKIADVIPQGLRASEIAHARRARLLDLDAQGLTMRALPLVFASQPEATRRALELLHRAIEIDPDCALATALAAWCHSQLVMYNGTESPDEEKSQALRLVQRAAVFDDDDPLVLASRSAVHTMAGQFDLAESLVLRALALEPSFEWAWGRSGWLHAYKGEADRAIRHFQRALSLNKEKVSRANYFAGLGAAFFNAGRYDSAAFWLQRALYERPDMWWANRSLSVSHLRMGNRLKALESLDRLRRFCPDITVGQVVESVPFGSDFLERLGNGLSDLGLPP
jgi:adenylate cyclase